VTLFWYFSNTVITLHPSRWRKGTNGWFDNQRSWSSRRRRQRQQQHHGDEVYFRLLPSPNPLPYPEGALAARPLAAVSALRRRRRHGEHASVRAALHAGQLQELPAARDGLREAAAAVGHRGAVRLHGRGVAGRQGQ